jgi:hypothetical protein
LLLFNGQKGAGRLRFSLEGSERHIYPTGILQWRSTVLVKIPEKFWLRFLLDSPKRCYGLHAVYPPRITHHQNNTVTIWVLILQ